jgi:hypothetical protein
MKLSLEGQRLGSRAEGAVEPASLQRVQRGGHDALADNVELGLSVDSGDCVNQFEVQRSVHVAVVVDGGIQEAAPALAITAPNDVSACFPVRLGGQHAISHIHQSFHKKYN